MDKKRKHLRVSIPEEAASEFEAAKRRTENALGVKMTDSRFAASMVRWAIEQRPSIGTQ